jgi:3-deoxy-D-manno-octulosonate 8-phosphate phosphatase (KDO 8-P phosphatase)
MNQQSESPELVGLARKLRFLLLDVDGVLTDGGIILIGGDQEAKRFDVQDGMGITVARAAGLKIGIITSRSSEVVLRRAKELKIDEIIQGVRTKTDALDDLVRRHGVETSQLAYIGDDIQDIPIMERVGIPIAVQNAVGAVKACSVYVTQASGGHGAVREAVEWLLDLRGDKEKAYRAVIGAVVTSSNV